MGMSQFAFARTLPGKWASSGSLVRVPASGVPTGEILGRSFDPNEEASAEKSKVK
jgi:hypothetical protein